MWYAYILENSESKRIYIGSTSDLRRRLKEHNQKRGGACTRKQKGNFKLIFYEAYLEKKDALKAENFFKSGYGREVLKDKLENYFEIKRNGA